MIHPKLSEPGWRRMDKNPDGWEINEQPRQLDLPVAPSDTFQVAIKIVDMLGNEDVFIYELPRVGDGEGVLVRRECYLIPIMEKELLKRIRRKKRKEAQDAKNQR